MLHFPSQKTLLEGEKKKHFEKFNMTKNLLSKKKLGYSTRVVIHIAIGCFFFTLKEHY
jgi:hypothetical protein